MSFETDITNIKNLVEAKPLFKPASDATLSNRREATQNPLYPVDAKAMDMTNRLWKSIRLLQRRIYELNEEKNQDRDECFCNAEKVEATPEGWEYTDLPGDDMGLNRYCLRCGGFVET